MPKTTRKLTGFLWAMLLAVISFFIIFIFFPDVSNKFFGVSLRSPKKVVQSVQDAVEQTTQSVIDKTTEAVSDFISEKITDTLTDKLK